MTYFAQDGSYGDSAGMVILDTRAWSEEQWNLVSEASDSDRVALALQVARENNDISLEV